MNRCRVRTLTVALAGVTGLLVTGVAWGDGLTVLSNGMATATLAAPGLHPTSLTLLPAGGKKGAINKGDQLSMTFSAQVDAGSICPGAISGGTQTLTGVTVTVSDGGASNDVLTVTAGPVTCLTPAVGTFDLGSPGHVAGLAVSILASELSLTQGATSSTLVLRLGTPTRSLSTPSGPIVVRYHPHASIAGTSGGTVSGTASTTSAVQF